MATPSSAGERRFAAPASGPGPPPRRIQWRSALLPATPWTALSLRSVIVAPRSPWPRPLVADPDASHDAKPPFSAVHPAQGPKRPRRQRRRRVRDPAPGRGPAVSPLRRWWIPQESQRGRVLTDQAPHRAVPASGPVAVESPDQPPVSVAELQQRVGGALTAAFPDQVWLCGEIVGTPAVRGGGVGLAFTLAESRGSTVITLRAWLGRPYYQQLQQSLGEAAEPGSQGDDRAAAGLGQGE